MSRQTTRACTGKRIKYRSSMIIDTKMVRREVDTFIDKGVVEWHTHLHGILDSFEYVKCWFPFATVHESYIQARNEIVSAYEEGGISCTADRERIWDKSVAYRDIVSILKELDDYNDKCNFTKHILSATTKESKIANTVNWNWAYLFRRIIRNSVVKKYDENINYQKIRLGDFATAIKIKEWLESKTGNWEIDIISAIEDKYGNEEVERRYIRFIVKNAEELHKQYITKKSEGYLQNLTVRLSLPTLKYNYMKAVFGKLCEYNNNVVRAEISASDFDICKQKVQLSSQLLDYLRRQHLISNTNEILIVGFLVPIATQDILDDMKSSDDKRIKKEIRKHIKRQEMLGIDLLGPEPKFNKGTGDNIEFLYRLLLETSKKEEKANNGQKRELTFRIHVGESNMSENRYDKNQAKVARKNVNIVLNTIDDLCRKDIYDDSRVAIRLGHVTAMTIKQAYCIIKKGIRFEINSISNMRTFAVENEGHLPILKILIAYVIYRYNVDKKDITKCPKPLCFTCNSDGNGVMRSSLREEYELNMVLIKCFVEENILESGVMPTVYVYKNDMEVLKNVVRRDCWDRYPGIIDINHFKPEVRDYFKNLANIRFFENSHPEP